MRINKITYKGKITFDYFEIWFGPDVNIFDHENFELDGKVEEKATCVSTQICPWCTKKYGLYNLVDRSPESIDDELKFYGDNGRGLDTTCGIEGCENGLADYADIPWEEGFTVTDINN